MLQKCYGYSGSRSTSPREVPHHVRYLTMRGTSDIEVCQPMKYFTTRVSARHTAYTHTVYTRVRVSWELRAGSLGLEAGSWRPLYIYKLISHVKQAISHNLDVLHPILGIDRFYAR